MIVSFECCTNCDSEKIKIVCEIWNVAQNIGKIIDGTIVTEDVCLMMLWDNYWSGWVSMLP